jgi:hypothetical protein
MYVDALSDARRWSRYFRSSGSKLRRYFWRLHWGPAFLASTAFAASRSDTVSAQLPVRDRESADKGQRRDWQSQRRVPTSRAVQLWPESWIPADWRLVPSCWRDSVPRQPAKDCALRLGRDGTLRSRSAITVERQRRTPARPNRVPETGKGREYATYTTIIVEGTRGLSSHPLRRAFVYSYPRSVGSPN